MALNESELEIEKEYLEKTLEVVENLIKEKDTDISINVSEINDFKKYLWSSLSDMDNIEIASNRMMIDSQVHSTNHSIRQLSQLKRSLSSPYFGRVDFYMDDDKEKVYVGINGINTEFEYYVFDWRSPIGSLFYNHGIGPASYNAPAGEIVGDIKLKRQYKVINGELIRCFESNINIDDEYLQEILSGNSSDKMKNIVNTIQHEQNTIIRNVTDKLLIVQGIAGSGKTSVALHRIAYLLYQEKDLTSNNILIFSPNSVFSEYISNVLPELGEENVMQSTFSDFTGSYVKEVKEVESFTDFVERYYKNSNDDEITRKIVSFKLSNEIKTYLDQFLIEYRKKIRFGSGINLEDKIITKEELDSIIQDRLGKHGLNDRLDYLTEYICDSFNVSEKKYAKRIRTKLIENLQIPLDLKKIYNYFLENIAVVLNIKIPICNKNKMNFEDLLPFLYLKFELFGYPKNRSIKHIIVDEAQDYNDLQFHILSRIFSNSSFTILGDINQTINPYYKHGTLGNISEHFSTQPKYIELTKTYRSSEEIIEYSNDILGLSNGVSVRHNSNIPVTVKNVEEDSLISNLISDIDTMRKNGFKRVAIITKTDDESIAIHSQLESQITNLSIITSYGKIVLSDIIVLPSYLAKGLEFDGVIAYTNPENLYSEKDKYLYYVVCTRAQHQLIVYNQKLEKIEKVSNDEEYIMR